MLANYCKSVGWKRFWIMVLGNIFVGMGVAIFKMSAMGNDPFNAMDMAVAAKTGIPYPVFQIIVNAGLFVVQLIAGRDMIGFGTIVNAVFLGYIATFFYNLLTAVAGLPATFIFRLITVFIGVIVCAFGLSLYQKSNAGVAPYDALAIIMDRKFQKVSYFWCRIITDACCAFVCFVFGGIIGIGTLVTVFGLGPFIHFFDKQFTEKVLKL